MKVLRQSLKVALGLFLMLNIGISVLAAPNVILEGSADGIVFIPGDEPFLLGPNMIPGDKVSRAIDIDNKHEVSYEVFMRAKRVSANEEYDLLNKLELTVYHKGEIIYKGPASGENDLSGDISLGVFKPGDITNLYAEVELDGPSTGNEYKSKSAQVDWIFTAISDQVIEKPTEPSNPTSPSKPTTTKPTTPPKTGDSSIALYVILAVISGGLLLVFMIKGKKRGTTK